MNILLIWFSKFIIIVLRFTRLGGGTSLPGLLIEKFNPSFLAKTGGKYKQIILITGTNGKTTTQNLLRHLLLSKETRVISNKSGANLLRGIAATVISDCNFFGKVRSDIAIFEVEEATMPHITKQLKSNYIIVTNLFRDQLDAYGEVVTTREYIVTAINQNKKATVLLNKDDRNVSSISNEIKNNIVYFSIEDRRVKDIFYERDFVSYKVRSAKYEVICKNVHIENDLSTTFHYFGLGNSFKNLRFSSPGIQNTYNALAAISVAIKIHKFTEEELRNSLSEFNASFGRGEIIKLNGKQIRLLLIKNPASFTSNLYMLKNILNLKLLIIINDKIADGTDVSWLWDADIEQLSRSKIAWITVSGTRAYDMGLRLKYADIARVSTEIEPNLNKAIDISLTKLKDGETLFILPTYTSMLEVRKLIGGLVKIKDFWK